MSGIFRRGVQVLLITSVLLALGIMPSAGKVGSTGPSDRLPSISNDDGDSKEVSGPPVEYYGAYNIELVAQLGGSAEAVDVQGSYAYLGMGQRLVVLDISDPTGPQLVGSSEILSGRVTQVIAHGNYVYLADSPMQTPGQTNRGRLRIMDVSNPAAPVTSGYFDTYGYIYDLDVAGNFAFLADSYSGLRVIDISNPQSPQLAATYNNPEVDVYGVTLAGNYAYVIDRDTSLRIVDITDPSRPEEVGYFDFPWESEDIAVVGDLAYIATRYSFRIVNVADPKNIFEVGGTEYAYKEVAYTRVSVLGNHAYVLDWCAGLAVFDISQSADIREFGYFGSVDCAENLSVVENMAFLVDGYSGLRILDLTEPPAIVEIGSYLEAQIFSHVDISGKYAYTAFSGDGLRIFDISDPARPYEIGFLETRGSLLAVAGAYAYLSERLPATEIDPAGRYFLHMIDVSDPENPVLAGSYETPGSIGEIVVKGEYAYCVYGGGLAILNISDPENIIEVGYWHIGAAHGLDIGPLSAAPGRLFAFIAADWHGLRIIDVTDPGTPQEVWYYNPTLMFIITGIKVDGDIVYLADYEGVIKKYDRSDPANPVLLASRSIGDQVWNMEIKDDYLYIAHGYKGFWIFEKNELYTAGRYVWLSWVSDAALSGKFVYLAGSGSGLFVVWFGPSTLEEVGDEGGILRSTFDATEHIFPSGVFTETAWVLHQPRYPGNMPDAPSLAGLDHFFSVSAYGEQDDYLEPTKPFTITVDYQDGEIGAIPEDSLSLYYWDGEKWAPETTSKVDVATNRVRATPDHFSLWGLFGEGERRIFLPVIER